MTTTTDKPTTISARDFVEQGYVKKIKRGQCVVTFLGQEAGEADNDPIADIVPSGNEQYPFRLFYKDGSDDGLVAEKDKFAVRWLEPATPPASESAATGQVDTVHVYPAIDKQGYDILAGGKLDRWKYDKGDAFEYALVLANDNIRELQTALTAASEREAALREAIALLKPVYERHAKLPPCDAEREAKKVLHAVSELEAKAKGETP